MAAFIRKVVLGAVTTGAAAAVLDRARQEAPAVPAPADHGQNDVFANAMAQIEQRRQTVLSQSPMERVMQSFDPSQWEVPRPRAISNVMLAAQYGATTTPDEMRSDAADVAKTKVVKAVAAMSLSGVVDATQKSVSVASGMASHGTDAVMEQGKQGLSTEGAGLAQAVGLGMVMAAPATLIPGPIGFGVRAALAMKMVGNVGHAVNNMPRPDSDVQDVMEKRVEAARSTRSGDSSH